MTMGIKKLGFIGMGILLVMTVYAAPTGSLKDTGQTQCRNAIGTVLENCTQTAGNANNEPVTLAVPEVPASRVSPPGVRWAPATTS
jgi:hypothetical protein